MSAKYDEMDDYVVTNLDDGEKYSVNEVTKQFNTIKLSNADSKLSSDFKDEFELESGIKHNLITSSYNPLSVPVGGRLTFFRISAVGTTKDVDDKVYSVFYLDVRCNVASPNSWFVYRRYSQFRRLSDVLRSEGYVVPVLPSKKILGSFSIDFIKQRKSDLESWLINLAEMYSTHPGAKNPQSHPYYRKCI